MLGQILAKTNIKSDDNAICLAPDNPTALISHTSRRFPLTQDKRLIFYQGCKASKAFKYRHLARETKRSDHTS